MDSPIISTDGISLSSGQDFSTAWRYEEREEDLPALVLTGRMVNMGTEGTLNVELGCKELFIFVRVTPDTDAMTHEYLSTESLTLVY